MKPTAVSVVIPAYNEAQTIADVIRRAQVALQDLEYEILVVDDGSQDGTGAAATELGVRVIQHRTNKGYGAALKSGIRQAQYEWIVTLDGDGQHNPDDIIRLLKPLETDCDSVVGVRSRDAYQYTARMPGKALLQWLAGYLVGERPEDVNSGLRVFRKTDALAYFPILPNGFSFSTTITLAMMKDAFRLSTISIQTAPRSGRRSTVSIKDGMQTILLIVRIAALFNPLKIFLPVSVLLFLIGFGYTVINILFKQFHIPSGALLLMLSGIIIFFFGILSDQLASILRSK